MGFTVYCVIPLRVRRPLHNCHYIFLVRSASDDSSYKIPVFSAGLQVSVVALVPAAGRLRCLLRRLSGAQGLVLLGAEHALRVLINIR